MKDNFSTQSHLYARFRPAYPRKFFDFLLSVIPGRERAWDCGTGNGQVAAELSKNFHAVYATDISENQIKNAARLPNIFYTLQPAEHTAFPDATFDLVTAAQAVHWFNFAEFY